MGMDYSHIDLVDLIDTLGVQDLAFIYPHLIPMLPPLIRDSSPLVEPTEVAPSPTVFDLPNSPLSLGPMSQKIGRPWKNIFIG